MSGAADASVELATLAGLLKRRRKTRTNVSFGKE